MTVGETVKALKEQFGWTSAKLAEEANLPVDTVNKICSGATRNPSMDTLQRIASAFGVPVDQLLGGSLPSSANPKNPNAEAFMAFYLAALENQKAAYEIALRHANSDKRRWFFIALALIAFVVFILTWDITHPNVGWFQY